MSGERQVVCVTGASGYIASWLVKLLLEAGYTVKATVRNLNDPKKVEHLKALEGAKERLHLFEANLVEEGSFDSVVDGCEGVFHTASPVSLQVTNPQTELIDPAVKGTLNVLRSCKKVPSIRRVVITSSMASVMFNSRPLNSDVIVDETWNSDPLFCEETKQWYALSKSLAEKAARDFCEQNGLELVTLHPGFVIGPYLQPDLNLTTEALLNLIKEGQQMWPSGIYRYVDVRDVARAHILAFENPSASGRYCLVERVMHSFDALKILSGIFPSLNLPAKDNDAAIQDHPYHVSKEKAKGLKLDFTPIEVTLRDTVQCFKDKNVLQF
ncbi:cinnamoyl-CoA reductase 1-like [Dorcoceras hygrometricum]|uniref:Dihydroflavonol 4-reductase n=1 Tax=Dorcoceras hygrometricum TaxID=472368 RepID=A0A2Z7C2V4_9LAMI|nr:cinnamoyl-CoA reductase 1-like [Dorcoceras hygrometricum]